MAALIEPGADKPVVSEAMFWPELMGEQKLEMDKIHVFEGGKIAKLGPVSHVKLNIFPDGGVSRLRIFGKLA
jgi:allantoicase